MYLVVECVTMSAPNSNGRQSIGVAKVLSTMSGMLCLWAKFAYFSMSQTTSVGLVSVSENTRRVLGRTAASSSSAVASGETKVQSMPKRFSVTPNRFTVPP